MKIISKLCKKKKISKSGYNKLTLFDKLNECFAVQKIQRFFRKKLYQNAINHITLEKVEFPCFIFKIPEQNLLYFYDIPSIITYIMKTGKTIDPMTRIQYSDEDLIRLDSFAKKYFPDKKFKNTLRIKNNPCYARKIINRENELLSIELRFNEIKTCILISIDSNIFRQIERTSTN
jgi:hypothetical protein